MIIRFVRSAVYCLLLLVILSPVVPRAYASSLRAGAVATASGSLNIRSSPSTNAPSVGRIRKGSYITLLSRSNGWWQVEYDQGKTGYCHGDYIRELESSAATVKIQSGTLNVRTGPGATHSRAGSLEKGETVLLLNASGGWSHILYHGNKTGYVSSQYLSGYYPEVTLSVPDLKQADSRWGDKILGSNGRTFAQIGCATTAIAMMESHRTGSLIFPAAMAQTLRYTPTGAVYWPSHFRVVTNSQAYLTGIYDALRQGKPVLFGAKNQYGAQHWVVITGYRGGDGLNAADFVIQDPGTASRRNLQQFIEAYPTFYKYFTY